MAIEDGKLIVIQFDQELQGDLESNKSRFTVTAPVYSMTPDWEAIPTEIPIKEISWYSETHDKILLELGVGNKNTMQIAAGPISIRYAGGTLRGMTGPLLSFVKSFIPTEVPYKGDQNDEEHVEVSDILLTLAITEVSYSDAQIQDEHVELFDIAVSYTLTHVDDL